MINFPNNPKVGDAFTHSGTIYSCVSITPIVWNAAPTAAGISDAPTDGLTYGRKNALWKGLDKVDVGLSNVDNTADANKVVSGPQQAALNTKEPVVGVGLPTQYYRGDKTWQVLNAATVGLGNVNNTPDISKTVQAAQYIRNGADPAGALIPFSWSDDGSQPAYIWGGNNTEGRVYYRPNLQVGYAATAGSAPANGGTAQNSNQICGIGNWRYSGEGNNPPWLWSTDGNAQNQFLTSPSTLSVNYANSTNYANSAGSAPANGGTSQNSNLFQGRDGAYWLNNADTAPRNIRNNSSVALICGISGYGDVAWGVSGSDERLKQDIADSQTDSLSKIDKLRFVQFKYRDMPWDDTYDVPGKEYPETFSVGDGRLHSIGIIAQQAESIDPQWINSDGKWKTPDTYRLLVEALHAIQQLNAEIKELRGSK